ncbi:VanZ family protein [Parathalassolituus penaei]|mgnify:CR=1 FL=1|uniref:VanZ family protein n=1 Tax=Parathalassolituus penaei TaxID=2997323 RepID=A0A9X3IS29_9GAMM|nr:VanZ family protein [Parathalassolituus penaei]MCY0965887.1 VanZ family protein [Parathalassolituus penaei]
MSEKMDGFAPRIFPLLVALAIGFFLFVLWIIIDADQGNPNIFLTWVRSIPYGDKFGHFGIFGLLTLLVTLATRCRQIRLLGLRCYLGAVLVAVFAVAEECTQSLFPTRTFDLGDLTADALAIALVVVALKIWQKSRIGTS